MTRDPNTASRVNLDRATVLLVDDNPQALDILSSIAQSFGVREQIRCASALEASEVVKNRAVDLIILDCAMPQMDGHDFVQWLRRETPEPVCLTPVIMLTGHAAPSKVHRSRDCGASFVVAKPLTPAVLLQRILWLASDKRDFVKSETYVGPDRRVRSFGPPLGTAGRRAGDLSTHVGEAIEANMDQSDIDTLIKPRRVAL